MPTTTNLKTRTPNVEITLTSENITDLFWVVYDLVDNTTYAQDAIQPPGASETVELALDEGIYQLVCSCHCDGKPSSIKIEVKIPATGKILTASASNDRLLVYTGKRPFVIQGDE